MLLGRGGCYEFGWVRACMHTFATQYREVFDTCFVCVCVFLTFCKYIFEIYFKLKFLNVASLLRDFRKQTDSLAVDFKHCLFKFKHLEIGDEDILRNTCQKQKREMIICFQVKSLPATLTAEMNQTTENQP